MRKRVMKLVSKFWNDPTVNEFGIVVLLKQIWVYARKIEDFGRGRRKNKLWRKKERRKVS